MSAFPLYSTEYKSGEQAFDKIPFGFELFKCLSS